MAVELNRCVAKMIQAPATRTHSASPQLDEVRKWRSMQPLRTSELKMAGGHGVTIGRKKMSVSAFRTIALAASALTSLLAVPALAQSAQGADDGTGADIVVTARRMEEKLQDVPISITVYNQEQLANRNIVNSHRTRRLYAFAVDQRPIWSRQVELRDPRLLAGSATPCRPSASISPMPSRRASRRTSPAAMARASARCSICRTSRC